jgi:hypothetical protein
VEAVALEQPIATITGNATLTPTHSRERERGKKQSHWIPAFAGMTSLEARTGFQLSLE